MKATRWIVGMAASLVVAACSGDDDEGGASLASLCPTACEHSDAAACPAEPYEPGGCEEYCRDLFSRVVPECEDAVRAYATCGNSRPQSDYECADGESGLKDGICQAEVDALATCRGG